MQDKVSIIYHKYCPYAQRALITAIQKGIKAEFISTGLGDDNRTPFFRQAYAKSLGRDTKITPQKGGKVPVLIHNDRYMAQSQLVCWYLAQSFKTGHQLIPQDPLKRAKMRIWITQLNVELISLFDRGKLKQVGVIEDFVKEVDSFLQKVDNSIEGSFLLGQQISLADILIYPWFERWVILEHFFGVSSPKKYPKVSQWLQNMNKRESIIQTKKLTTQGFYIQRTERMIAAWNKPKL